MNPLPRRGVLVLVALFGFGAASFGAADPWHDSLCLSGGGWWRQRIRIVVHNETDRALAGQPVAVAVGKGDGEADLAGAAVERLRVCNAEGVEMLFGVTAADSAPIEAGPVSEGGRLVIPAECEAKSQAVYYVYFDNPAAGAVPDFFNRSPVASKGDAVGTPEPRAVADKPEAIGLVERGADAAWYDDDPGDDVRWESRAAVRVFNFSTADGDSPLVRIDLAALKARARRGFNEDSIRVTLDGKLVKHYQIGDVILAEGDVPPRSVQTYYVYCSADPKIQPLPECDFAALVASRHNRVDNPSFEQGQTRPDGWSGVEGIEPSVTMDKVEPGAPGLGRYCARLQVPPELPKLWRGWHQDVAVRPGASYFVAGWLKCGDLDAGARTENDSPDKAAEGRAAIYLHVRNAQGQLCAEDPMRSVGPIVTGTTDWTRLGGMLASPPDAATLQVHLTTDARGTLWHDGIVVAEVVPATVVGVEHRAAKPCEGLVAWPVNAVVKVFREDVPPETIPEARISLARNEKEPLQLAIRSSAPQGGQSHFRGEDAGGQGNTVRAAKIGTVPSRQLRVEVDPPVGPGGAKLDGVEVGVVGYVPIDYPTAYYQSTSPAWHRKVPKGPTASDGWPGWWPDPLLPRDTLDVEAERTQAAWITVAAGKDAPPGNYRGRVRLVADGKPAAEVPFVVHVWDFTLPDESHVKAIYDLRFGPAGMRYWNAAEPEVRRQVVDFMAQRRLCPHQVLPDPDIRYENGRVAADFTEFDKAASYSLDELKLPHSYTPHAFYLFGWAHPPDARFGESPYPGKAPYEDADHARLRPEYKKRFQECLKVYWDHVKAKGWDKKIVLYICDEPFFDRKEIREQMKALCDMIHEVDPAIPIYSSTWRHVPEWNGYLDVWGISHSGRVPLDEMRKLQAAGDRVWFTTDGQMCTDTPYLAVERLLPHYCFQTGAEAYEFWGVAWHTLDPYHFGWHSYIHQSDTPGKSYWVRYPNGDGYLIYPGGPVGHDGPVSSIRLEQAREGVEDYEYLYLLRERIARAKAAGRDVTAAEATLRRASDLTPFPNAGGLRSSEVLPDPDAVFAVKASVAQAIEGLREP